MHFVFASFALTLVRVACAAAYRLYPKGAKIADKRSKVMVLSTLSGPGADPAISLVDEAQDMNKYPWFPTGGYPRPGVWTWLFQLCYSNTDGGKTLLGNGLEATLQVRA